jgi:hypothetical protein
MQTLGRVAIISGLVAVAVLNIWMFADVADMSEQSKTAAYARIYLLAFIISAISVLGVVLAGVGRRRRVARLLRQGLESKHVKDILNSRDQQTQTRPPGGACSTCR